MQIVFAVLVALGTIAVKRTDCFALVNWSVRSRGYLETLKRPRVLKEMLKRKEPH
jgi:hypothetical protein